MFLMTMMTLNILATLMTGDSDNLNIYHNDITNDFIGYYALYDFDNPHCSDDSNGSDDSDDTD